MCFLDGETKHDKPIYKTLNPNQQYYKKLSFNTGKKKNVALVQIKTTD